MRILQKIMAKKSLWFVALFLSVTYVPFVQSAQIASPSSAPPAPAIQNKYVGVEACVECHEEIVQNFRKNSEKAVSDKAILKMRRKLTPAEFQECFSCHTTGYGEASGFVSFEQTPHLAHVGCEACHGMGYLHTQEQTAESLSQKPTIEVCQKCHDDGKVTRIFYDGRIHAGGH